MCTEKLVAQAREMKDCWVGIGPDFCVISLTHSLPHQNISFPCKCIMESKVHDLCLEIAVSQRPEDFENVIHFSLHFQSTDMHEIVPKIYSYFSSNSVVSRVVISPVSHCSPLKNPKKYVDTSTLLSSLSPCCGIDNNYY